MEPFRRRARRALVPLLTAALLPALSACRTPEASRTLYAWTDAEGNVRYTPYPESIPTGRRDTRQPVVEGARATVSPPPPGPVVEDLPRTTPPTPAVETAPVAEEPAESTGPLEARIAALEARIAADQEALKALIADPESAARLRESPEMREISERLPALQRELETLRAERSAASSDGS